MAKKTTKITKPIEIEEEETQSRSSLFDYLRFGESYTSLVLGIIVVIISTVLLLSFVHNKNVEKDTPQLLSQKDIILPSAPLTTPTSEVEEVAPTITPTPTKAPVAMQKAATPTPTPTKKVEPTKVQPTKVVAQANPTPTKEKVAQGSVNPQIGQYTVGAGESLWTIAEKQYKSGYNWVDIARANKLSNPGVITTGQKLTLPRVEQKIATVTTPQNETTIAQNKAKITGDTYKIAKGDTLWDISVRAYGDGYQWSKIASANKLSNPSLIHVSNNLKIPRGK